MSATNPSRHFQVLLRRVRKSALACPSISHKLQAVPCCSTRQAPAAAFSTSAITRNPEQSLLGNASEPSAVLHPTLKASASQHCGGQGYNCGVSLMAKKIEDTTCGAAVACIGYDNERVKAAMIKQMDNFSYSNSMFLWASNWRRNWLQSSLGGPTGRCPRCT